MSSILFELSDDDLESLQDHQNPYLSRPEKGLALLTALVGRPSQQVNNIAAQKFSELHALVDDDYLKLGDGYPETALVFRELGALVDSLEELVLFPVLANKTVVGIGGGFSAGKSRFVNSLLGETFLPEALEPSTAIPTFVLRGHSGITGVNAFGQQVELDANALGAISHDFHTQYRERFGVDVGFAHVLRDLLLRSPDFRWGNLALLDTPGYNRSDNESNVLRDDALTLAQLRNADHVLWLIKGSNGDLRADDAAFLHQVGPRHPVFFVVSQADLISPSDVDAVVEKVRQTATAAGLACAGVGAWAAPMHSNDGNTLAGDDVVAWLQSLAAEPKRTDKRRRCSALLDRHLEHNARLLANNRALLTELNKLQVLAEAKETQHTALASQISRLKDEQRHINQRITTTSHIKDAMVLAINTLLGDQVLDETPPASQEITKVFTRKDVPGSWTKHDLFDCEVSECRADLKRLFIGFKKRKVTVHVPYSAVKDIWQRNPQSVRVGEKLQARVMEADDREILLAFSQNDS